LTCRTFVNTRGLDFGTHFSSEGTITTGPANFAQWDGSTGAGTRIRIAFTGLPSHLINMVAGTGQMLPITFGNTSGLSVVASLAESFNPFIEFVPVVPVGPDGQFQVFLGAPSGVGGLPELVSVDLTGAPAGTYQATITLTVAVL